LNSLTPNNVYYIRVFSISAFSFLDFDICMLTPVSPPLNDECNNATVLTPSANNTCTVPTASTTAGATQSQVACVATANDDVWFSFTASQANHTILISNVVPVFGTSSWRIVEVFDGCSGNSIYCSNSVVESEIYLTNLSASQDYLIRVHTYGIINSIDFDIC